LVSSTGTKLVNFNKKLD